MTKWQYEYRAFMDADPTAVRSALDSSMSADGLVKKVQQEKDLYCVAGATDIAVRLRGTEVKMKGPIKAVDDLVDEMYDARTSLPVDSNQLADELGLPADKKPQMLKREADITAYMKRKGAKTSTVEKDMVKYEGQDLEVEVSGVKIDGSQAYTICVASSDPAKIRAAIEKYGIKGLGTKMHYAEAVKQKGL